MVHSPFDLVCNLSKSRVQNAMYLVSHVFYNMSFLSGEEEEEEEEEEEKQEEEEEEKEEQ